MPLTGQELLGLVRDAMEVHSPLENDYPATFRRLRAALTALDGCVLLTAEEAETVHNYIRAWSLPDAGHFMDRSRALALLGNQLAGGDKDTAWACALRAIARDALAATERKPCGDEL